MPLQLLDYQLDGKTWEELCISCYRIKYPNSHFQEVPATYKGDGGIEGFTKDGIVIQCYCPDDQNLSNDDLYEKQRDKVTNDINKLISSENGKLFKSFGLTEIREWHFLVPEYKDRRILQHIEKKKQLVLEKIKLKECEYISENFQTSIKVAPDLRIELYSLIRTQALAVKLNLQFRENSVSEWSDCDNEKVENIKRKLLAINPQLSSKPDAFSALLNTYMTAYLDGIELLKRIGINYPELRKDILDFANEFKKDVSSQTLLNSDHTLNAALFKQLGNEFEIKIAKQIEYLDQVSILTLKTNLISSWLADCSMEFWGDLNE